MSTGGGGTQRRIFITGGASGLGRAMALLFARRGWRVAIGDVHAERGEAVRGELGALGEGALFLRCDVTREEDLGAAAARLEREWGGVDVVVNNAGVAGAGAIEDVSLEDWRWIIDINLLGVVRGCRAFVPLLKRQGAGHLVNVASMAGLLDVPMMSSYNATKAAVVSLSETLQNELAETGVGVTVVCPSFFQTNLAESMRTSDPGLRAAMGKLLGRSKVTAEDVAEDVFRAVERREFYVLPHAEGRAAWRLKRFLPRARYLQVIGRQFRRMRAAAGGGGSGGSGGSGAK
jgi:NAD(P)-dependent dehydrogenase (short-subunit alcohol dehydrogenase family)